MVNSLPIVNETNEGKIIDKQHYSFVNLNGKDHVFMLLSQTKRSNFYHVYM